MNGLNNPTKNGNRETIRYVDAEISVIASCLDTNYVQKDVFEKSYCMGFRSSFFKCERNRMSRQHYRGEINIRRRHITWKVVGI